MKLSPGGANRVPTRIVEADSDHAVAAFRNLLIIIWRHETLPEAVARASKILQALIDRSPGGVGLLQICEVGVRPPDSAARAAVAKMLHEGREHVLCSSLVYSGTGFWMAAARAFVTGLTILSRTEFPHIVFATINEAADWHARLLSDESTNKEAILAAVGEVTRALDLHAKSGSVIRVPKL